MPKHNAGYKWHENGKDLVPKNADTEYIVKSYDAGCYDDFRRLVKYSYETKKVYKNEILRFARLWGNPFLNYYPEHDDHQISLETFGLLEFNSAIKFYKKISENIPKNKTPNLSGILVFSSSPRIEYQLDKQSKQIMPTYIANMLWEAIQFTIVFSGHDAQRVGEICAREGCENRVVGKRADANFCSEKCRWKNDHLKKKEAKLKHIERR